MQNPHWPIFAAKELTGRLAAKTTNQVRGACSVRTRIDLVLLCFSMKVGLDNTSVAQPVVRYIANRANHRVG